MSDFQKYLDEAFSKINTSDFSDSEEDLPRDDVYKEIQQLIVSERKKQKVTQKELAHRTGLSQANISNIENGVTRPTIDSLQKIAEALGKRLLVCFEESEDI
ncbi:MAG: helix-turn-helix domain-containing protein [Oscillospiraceae bacterium]|jgi:ribosome-binding protein aMBF1 (putative translation factor)|uniref:helix-turn-helix domain-containing protein n=1 Tax=Eubacteriales TaxID=186802 RepID=UPI000E4C36F8|nr:helix-turn-helix transcriptional regulator [Butyricicoccus sp. BIOML-A1]MZT27834.1 helix-turn-helix domain-containing protein [Butyricicoccus sp. BIOML-A1]RHS81199.1 XRE family transcriptional regulator [Butyricicoccus sp. AM42-5AC]RHT58155.1 XRE family transcriptional regulator [Butyricicoccus sp. AM29-23AC]RHV38948.1 XRE family transcriptional regulator [Butyricicoccus sp. OM04-18BH]